MPRDGYNPDRLILTIDWPEITLERLSRITSLWSSLVASVSTDAAGRKQAIKWVIANVTFGSPLTVETWPELASKRVDPAVIHRVSHAVVEGFAHLETRPDEPEFFSTHSLNLAKTLALMTDSDKDRRIYVANGTTGPVQVSMKTAATVESIFGPVVESYGSVEGQLEGVITHGKRRFYVYDSLTGKQVRCLFDDARIPLDEILRGFDKRVSVSGLIKSKALTGEDQSIEATEFRIIEPPDDLRGPDEILRVWGER